MLPLRDGIRMLWATAGICCVMLGIAGLILPLMPGTVFFILALGCFGRSSPTLEAWLLNHRRIGPTLIAWRQHHVIPRRAKVAACGGMAAGFVALLMLHAAPPILWCAAVGMLASAAFILSRPGIVPR